MKSDIKWLFFDMGGTLIDESGQESVIIKTAGDALGISHEKIYNTMIEMSVAYKSPAKEALRALSGSDELLARLRAEGKYYPPELEKLFPGASETLIALSRRYKLGVIGNQKPGLERRLKDYGIHGFFSAFAGSGDININKPDPAIFLYALNKAGCEARQAVMIGDRLDNDIYPAKKLGFTTVWIKQGLGGYQKPRCGNYEADYTVDKIEGIAELFAAP